jgi:hypothetical protein
MGLADDERLQRRYRDSCWSGCVVRWHAGASPQLGGPWMGCGGVVAPMWSHSGPAAGAGSPSVSIVPARFRSTALTSAEFSLGGRSRARPVAGHSFPVTQPITPAPMVDDQQKPGVAPDADPVRPPTVMYPVLSQRPVVPGSCIPGSRDVRPCRRPCAEPAMNRHTPWPHPAPPDILNCRCQCIRSW